VNGKPVTADEVQKILIGTPAQARLAFQQDPQKFMKEYAWYTHLQSVAEKKGLHNETPYKQLLEFNRMLTLVQAMYNKAALGVVVLREQEEAHYNANKDKYKEVHAKLIYVPFSADASTAPTSGRKVLTEAEAKNKAAKIVAQARSGGDFVKLVKEHSEDAGSVAQNGDIGVGVRSSTTHIPETMRNAILALQAGQISDPVRHDNGYYIFRAESAGVLPFEKVREEIHKELKNAGLRDWERSTQAEATVQLSNEEFFRNLAKSLPAQ
jgi:parvulin-like peptidyl-prolyl isomerase